MALRDKPQARCTRDTPPYGNTKASLAAVDRHVRSSNIRPDPRSGELVPQQHVRLHARS